MTSTQLINAIKREKIGVIDDVSKFLKDKLDDFDEVTDCQPKNSYKIKEFHITDQDSEKDNELLILWTSGLNKIYIVNLIFRISLLIMFIQIFLTSAINPTLLNFSSSIIKNSQLEFVPSLLRERQFNDTVEGLTIFVEKKSKNLAE